MALCEWLAPYHDHARPPPEAVLAEATKPAGKGAAGKGTQSQSQSQSQSGSGTSSPKTNGHKKLGEEPPAVKEAPECVAKFFDGERSYYPVRAGMGRLMDAGVCNFRAL